MIEQTICPSCDSTNLELRTDNRVMCSSCGYIFPEPAAHPNDETPTNVEMPIMDEDVLDDE